MIFILELLKCSLYKFETRKSTRPVFTKLTAPYFIILSGAVTNLFIWNKIISRFCNWTLEDVYPKISQNILWVHLVRSCYICSAW